MDSQRSAQDLLECHLCETSIPNLYCDICDTHLCKTCVGEHLSDESTKHNVVAFKKRNCTIYNYPRCPKHSSKRCELHCKLCDIPICVQCVSSAEHDLHKKIEITKRFEIKKSVLHRDLQELETSINPKFENMLSCILVQKTDLNKHSQEVTAAINRHGEELHKEIDTIIQKLK